MEILIHLIRKKHLTETCFKPLIFSVKVIRRGFVRFTNGDLFALELQQLDSCQYTAVRQF